MLHYNASITLILKKNSIKSRRHIAKYIYTPKITQQSKPIHLPKIRKIREKKRKTNDFFFIYFKWLENVVKTYIYSVKKMSPKKKF